MEDSAGVARVDAGSPPWLELAVYAREKGIKRTGQEGRWHCRLGCGIDQTLLETDWVRAPERLGPAVILLGGTRQGMRRLSGCGDETSHCDRLEMQVSATPSANVLEHSRK